MVFMYVFQESDDSSVGIVNRAWTGQPRDSGSTPSKGRSVQCPQQPIQPAVQLIPEASSWDNVTQELG
jgi:hypothetical protein